MNLADYYRIKKRAKARQYESAGKMASSRHNFPGGPATISISGSAEIVIDERPFATGGCTKTKYQIDGDLTTPIRRINFAPATEAYVPNVTENVFFMSQQPAGPWRIVSGGDFGSITDIKVGTFEIVNYINTGTIASPVFEETDTETGDLEGGTNITLGGGGHPASGGRGPDDPEKHIDISVGLGGGSVFPAPSAFWGLGGDSDYLEYDIPYPWDSPWQSVSSMFDTALQAEIDYYAEWEIAVATGRTSLKVFFLNAGAPSRNFSAARNSMFHPLM